MNNSNAADQYRIAQFESASPVKILQLLYAGAIRYLKLALEKDPKSQAFREEVRRAEDILSELRASLNHEPNPDLSANLEGLYLFMQRELGRSIIDGETTGIEGSINILDTLLDGWKQAAKSIDDPLAGSSPNNISHVS